MTQKDLFKKIAENTELSKKQVESVLVELGNIVINAQVGERIILPFCYFSPRYAKPKQVKVNGKEVTTTEKVQIKFGSKFSRITPEDPRWDHVTDRIKDSIKPPTTKKKPNSNKKQK